MKTDNNISPLSYLTSLVLRTVTNSNTIMKVGSTSKIQNPLVRPALSPESLPYNLPPSEVTPKVPYEIYSDNEFSDVTDYTPSKSKDNRFTSQRDIKRSEEVSRNQNPHVSSENLTNEYMKAVKADINHQRIKNTKADTEVGNKKHDSVLEKPLSFTKHQLSKRLIHPSDRLAHISSGKEESTYRLAHISSGKEESTLLSKDTMVRMNMGQQMRQIPNVTTKKISVTIEHIEIKAVRTNSSLLTHETNQVKPQNSSLMSLKQYLSKRSRGVY